MSGVPKFTAGAREYLRGHALVLRASVRRGCCGGGTTMLPMAETGRPSETEGYDFVPLQDFDLYVDRRLGSVEEWTIDTAGFWRWQRLVIDGATMLPVSGEDPHLD